MDLTQLQRTINAMVDAQGLSTPEKDALFTLLGEGASPRRQLVDKAHQKRKARVIQFFKSNIKVKHYGRKQRPGR